MSTTNAVPRCAHCGANVTQAPGAINRAIREGKPLYCNRKCAGLGRRRKVTLTPAQKKAAKAAYDKKRRTDLAEEIKAAKAAWFEKDYAAHPEKYRAERQRRMAAHVEYCRRPEYKAKKHIYDVKRGAQERYGPFAESFLLLQEIDKEVAQRMTLDIALHNGFINKAQTRRRALA